MNLEIPAGDLDTYLGFLDESREHLDDIEQKVLGLSRGVDPDVINSLFRALHTIKGIAGFLALTDIQQLAHRLESVFDAIRQGSLNVTDDLLRASLDNLDGLAAMIDRLEAGLKSREARPDGGWGVAVEDVEYQAGYLALGSFLEGAGRHAHGGTGPVAEDGDMPPEALITPEMKAAFVKESEDLLEATELVFLKLEAEPGHSDSIAQAFRSIHSFKGNCGFFGYADLEQASHRLETALDGVRAAGGAMPKAHIETTLRCLDLFRSAVAGIAAGGSGAIPDLPSRLRELDSLTRGAAGPETPHLGEILVAEHQATPEAIDFALSLQNRPLGEVLVQEGLATPAAVERALDIQRQAAGKEAAAPGNPAVTSPKAPQKEAKRDLRVDLAKLDHLMDLVGELVISTGMVFNHPVVRDSGATDLEKIAHQLRGVVSDLQAVALGVRMVPIEATFRKMTRLVHDLSAKVGKKVRLEFRGESTEVDKTVTDLIADPLVHMIRNSIDHGLESPADRAAAGKDTTGTVTLEAGQEGGEILITIRDDGRGLDRKRILAKAVERGLAGPEATELPDAEVFHFIFHPGFSTAEAVTATSGRGVGMDVVKSNIEKLGGRIHIGSRPGAGASITLRIPLTLSIIDGMMVKAGEALFILPLLSVRESLAPRAEQLFTLAGGQEMLLLRGRSLPIVRLGRQYRIPGCRESLTQGLLIHLDARGTSFCLAVDDLVGQRQVVVKALPGFTNGVAGISSCSILDNGEIALILDVAGLAQLQGVESGPGAPRSLPRERKEAA